MDNVHRHSLRKKVIRIFYIYFNVSLIRFKIHTIAGSLLFIKEGSCGSFIYYFKIQGLEIEDCVQRKVKWFDV